MRSFLMLLLLLTPGLANAQLFTGTMAGGMGNSGRAAIDPSESAYLNPASVAYFGAYTMTGAYQMGDVRNSGAAQTQSGFKTYGLQISDGSSNNIVPGAISYLHNVVDLDNSVGGGNFTQDDFQISLGEIFFSRFAFGLSVHHLMQNGRGIKDRQTNATLGVMYTPTERIGIGLVGYDLIPSPESLQPGRALNAVYGLGTNILFTDSFSARADIVKPGVGSRGRADVGIGLQSYFNEFLAVRLGLQLKETADQTNLTAGFGYRGPKFSIDYSFQQDTRSGGYARHLVDLYLPL